MDDDDLRRGKPSNHKVFGEATALLAGDGLLTGAFEQALAFSGPPADGVRGARVLAQCAGAAGMVGGQCIDLSSEGQEVDLSLLREMDQGKTVALISAACQLGCIAAGAGEEALQGARSYAEGLGMAFQIRDDVLDVLGDAAALGKNVGMDSARDKRNYVSLLGGGGGPEAGVLLHCPGGRGPFRLFRGHRAFCGSWPALWPPGTDEPHPLLCDSRRMAGRTVKDFCRQRLGLSSRAFVKQKHLPGGLSRNGAPCRSVDLLAEGDILALRLPREEAAYEPVAGPLEILWETEDYLVVNKPTQMPVHPSPGTAGTACSTGWPTITRRRASPRCFAPCTGWTGTPAAWWP